MGMTAFNAWLSGIVEVSGLPDNNSTRQLAAQFLFHIGRNRSYISTHAVVVQLKRAAVLQVASAVIKDTEYSGPKAVVDIEDEQGKLKRPNRPSLKAATANKPFDLGSGRHDIVARQSEEARAEYFRLVGHKLHDGTFKTRLDKRIWTLHAEGVAYTAIAASVRRSVSTVKLRIATMRKDFGL